MLELQFVKWVIIQIILYIEVLVISMKKSVDLIGSGWEPEKLDLSTVVIDREQLDKQLQHSREILLGIARDYTFNSFSHFLTLAEKIQTDDDIKNAVRILEEWDYRPLDYISLCRSGNCVDFAVLAQQRLLDVGIPTMVIGKLPEEAEFTSEQRVIMGYRHTSLLYINGHQGTDRYFMFEPGWKFPEPIDLSPGITVRNNDWEFHTESIDARELHQGTYNVKKMKKGQRIFDLTPLSVPTLSGLTKKLMRIPRKMELINRFGMGDTQVLRYDPITKMFSSTISELPRVFMPEDLNQVQKNLINQIFDNPNTVAELQAITNLLRGLPEDFWII